MLCDYRCIKCSGPLNTQCTACRNMFYLWTNNTICDDVCPSGQYKGLDLAFPLNETKCANCFTNCLTCEVKSTNCSTCKGANYAFYTGGTTAFLYFYNNSYSECITTCPASADNLTKIGYYGSFVTLTCYPCPTPCSNCNINIIRTRYPDITCESDKFCNEGLVCTSCLQNYVVVGGQCINENSCR